MTDNSTRGLSCHPKGVSSRALAVFSGSCSLFSRFIFRVDSPIHGKADMNAATRFALCILVGALSGNGHAVADVVEFEANFSTEFALGCIGEMSDGTGFGSFLLDTDTGQVDYTIEFADLSSPETMAHLHGPATRGCNFAQFIIPSGPRRDGPAPASSP